MPSLVRLYAANVLKPEAVIRATGNLSQLSLSEDDQLNDENLGIGDSTWTYLSQLEEEHDASPFFTTVRAFYIKSIEKMLKKFPFNDSMLNDLGILQPDKVHQFKSDTVVKLAKRFPQLGLDNPQSIGRLREEFMDFILSAKDLPVPETYAASDGSKKPKPGSFWVKVGKMRTLDGTLRFGLLYHLMSGLLSIPCSNADSERGFSMLRKIHTDHAKVTARSVYISCINVTKI
jgi:hypothetical protein